MSVSGYWLWQNARKRPGGGSCGGNVNCNMHSWRRKDIPDGVGGGGSRRLMKTNESGDSPRTL